MEASRATRPIHILLTGPPGIGKTQICEHVVSILEQKDIRVDGFYIRKTNDCDDEHYSWHPINNIVKFDIVRLNSYETITLARHKNLTREERTEEDSRYCVGNYNVFLNNFETVAVPILDSTNTDILLIDEIDKMELLSKNFKRKITNIFFGNSRRKKAFVIGSIPQIHRIPQQHAALFHKLYTDERIEILNVSYENRTYLPQKIIRHFSQSHVD